MRVVLLCVLLAVLAGAALLVLLGRAQVSVCLVAEPNGIWLRFRLAVGPITLVSLQLRWHPGRPARLLRRGILMRRWKPAEVPPWVHPGPQWGKDMPFEAGEALALLRKLQVEMLDVHVRLGVRDDAAATALLCGLISSTLQALRAALACRQGEPAGHIVILPDFSKKRLSVRFRCILTLQIRHSIPVILQSVTGRNSNGSSNRKYHADYHGEHTQHG